MLSEMVCGGPLHTGSTKMGSSRAALARIVQPAADVTPAASPAAHIVVTQRADVTFRLSNLMP
jgi:hypothetical protein